MFLFLETSTFFLVTKITLFKVVNWITTTRTSVGALTKSNLDYNHEDTNNMNNWRSQIIGLEHMDFLICPV